MLHMSVEITLHVNILDHAESQLLLDQGTMRFVLLLCDVALESVQHSPA